MNSDTEVPLSKLDRVSYGVRYIYLEEVVPIQETLEVEFKNPETVPNVFGAIGFEFYNDYRIKLDDSQRLRHIEFDQEVYYWGQEITKSEIKKIPGLKHMIKQFVSKRYVITYWGGIIPIPEFALVIPYPNTVELPADMRFDG